MGNYNLAYLFQEGFSGTWPLKPFFGGHRGAYCGRKRAKKVKKEFSV